MLIELPKSFDRGNWEDNERICEMVVILQAVEYRISLINFGLYVSQPGLVHSWKQIEI